MSISDDKQTSAPLAGTAPIVPPEPSISSWTELPRAKVPHDGMASSDRYHLYEFHSGLLPDDRTVIVYVPERYQEDEARRFPVFYMHDGQNLFDGRTSYVAGCTWRVPTTADRLTEQGLVEPILFVGIYNTGIRRMPEYTPTRDPALGGGEGDMYGRLLVEEVKPFIDEHFRSRPDRHNTALGGSSLGGLISLYLGLTYSGTFGKLAVLSPSIWWDGRSILELVRRTRSHSDLQIWLDMGTAEGSRHLRDADLLYRLLLRNGWRDGLDLSFWRVEGAVHDENAWADRFGRVLQFLFPASGASLQASIAERPKFRDT